jgi:hypothetical protein
LREAGTYIDFTWALVLIERPRAWDAAAGAHPGQLFTACHQAPVTARGLVDATYGVAMLRAIARRAENPDPAGT